MIRKSGNRFSEKIMRKKVQALSEAAMFPSPATLSQTGRNAGRRFPKPP